MMTIGAFKGTKRVSDHGRDSERGAQGELIVLAGERMRDE